jgi:heat shock protein HslJ
MNIEFNKVTWYSKLLAIIIFVLTFYIGYYLGQNVENLNSSNKKIETPFNDQLLVENKNNISIQSEGDTKSFEGEADSSKMTLRMKTWNWINTTYSDDKIVKPIKIDKFSLTFKDNKNFSATTDCNGIGGEYTVNGNKISFDKMMSTLMYCDGSQESDFSKMLSETGSYMFTSKGELVLLLKYDSGSVIFE